MLRMRWGSNDISPVSHITPIPIPGLRSRLSRQIYKDWVSGIETSEMLWVSTQQQITIVKSIYDCLLRTEPKDLIPKIQCLGDSRFWTLNGFVRGYRLRYFSLQRLVPGWSKAQEEQVFQLFDSLDASRHNAIQRTTALIDLRSVNERQGLAPSADVVSLLSKAATVDPKIESINLIISDTAALTSAFSDLASADIFRIVDFEKPKSHSTYIFTPNPGNLVDQLWNILEITQLYHYCTSSLNRRQILAIAREWLNVLQSNVQSIDAEIAPLAEQAMIFWHQAIDQELVDKLQFKNRILYQNYHCR